MQQDLKLDLFGDLCFFILLFAAPSLSITPKSSESLVYTAGTFFSLTCTYLNTSLVTTTTPSHPWLTLITRVPLPNTVLLWQRNTKIFSTRNRKR